MPFTAFFPYSYTILAASAVPKGFVDAKKVAEAVLEAIQLDKNDYRLGSTKVYNDIRFNTERVSVKQILNIFSLFYFDRNFF